MDSPIFLKEKFTEREAWEWLISGAAWQSEGFTVSINHNPVKVGRGQLTHSLRFMGVAWGWDKAKVSRFLEKLKKWDMIETATETGQILVTICNYNIYQDSETASETPQERKPRQTRDRGETNIKNLNNIKKEEVSIFSSFWDVFPRQRRGSKDKAQFAWEKATQRANPEEILAGCAAYAMSREVKEGFGKGAAAWLNDDRWTHDYSDKLKPKTKGYDPNDVLANALNDPTYAHLRRGGGDNRTDDAAFSDEGGAKRLADYSGSGG